MEASPHPPMLMPRWRIRVNILSRVATSRHVIAQNVPRPRALWTKAGNFSSNACKPAKSVRPAICVFWSKLSRRMTRNVTSNSASFDGSPSQVHLFGKRHQIWRFGQIPVLVGPHPTSGTASGLHFVDNKRCTGLFGQLLQVGEKFLGRKIVPTFGLYRFHQHGGDISAPLFVHFHQLLHLGQTLLIFISVVIGMLVERIFVTGKRRHRPVESWHVDLVYRFGMGAREAGQRSTVKAALKAEHAQLRRSGRLVLHRTAHIVRGRLFAATLLCSVPYESSFERVFVGTRTAHHRRHVLHTRRCDDQQRTAQRLDVIFGRIHAQSWSIDKHTSHVGRFDRFYQIRVVVTDWD
ncbi:hypothetical protein T03_14406 [Trichinella britovi]|uniref:Uncharacterized protein n=1 Tax=Trichinella britovi TaxID=45882 RepID=A0A0V1D2F2_TRIBR|nr:hypothetical protein T03_14406 [Trichinella britovi]